MSNFPMRLLSAAEQYKILPLWQECFPDYWEQLAVANGQIPYEEISFAAFDGETAIAHCGIIPYDIWCGNRLYRMGGIASVATAPAYRKRGIAAELCGFAANWAAENGFDSLPLYTGLFRVYEAAKWRKLEVPETYLIRISGKALSWCKGDELTAAEKNEIIKLYEAGEKFDGKVLRQNSGTLHSWARIFAEPEFRFAVIPGSYAVKSGNVVIETGFAPESGDRERQKFLAGLSENGQVSCYLPPTADNRRLLNSFPLEKSSFDAMHGERPMVRDFGAGEFHRIHNIYFPVVDKF